MFMEYSDRIFRFLYYKSGNEGLSQDLAQEAFLRTWKNCKQVTLDKAKSYLFTIANNLFLDEVKHQKVVRKFQLAAPPKSSTRKDGQYLMEEQEFKAKLEDAIAQLPEGQRLVFLMNRIEKMKYKDIAELLDISVKAVEKRMSLALKSLRGIYDKI